MDPTVASLVTVFSTAIAALFGAFYTQVRRQAADWERLYREEKADHKDTLKAAATVGQQNSQAIHELAEFIHELPRRREDWARSQDSR